MKNIFSATFAIACFSALALFFVGSMSRVESEENAVVVMIVNAKLGLVDTKIEPLSKLYLGKTQSLGGKTVVPIKPAEEGVYSVFRKVVLKMDEKTEKEYWLKETFKGTAKPVKQVPDAAAVAAFVAKTENGIGITTMSEYEKVKDKVAILKIAGKAALN